MGLGHTLWLFSHWGKLLSKSRELQYLDAFWPNIASQEKRAGCMRVLGVPPLSGEGKEVNFDLSDAAAAVSSGQGWVDNGPGRCVILPLPGGSWLSHSWLATLLLSKACHPPWRALGESDGPTAHPCDSGWVVHGLRVCTGMGGTSGDVVLGFGWMSCSSEHAEGSCQAVFHNAQPRES